MAENITATARDRFGSINFGEFSKLLLAYLKAIGELADQRAESVDVLPDPGQYDSRLAQGIMRTVQMIGGAVITIAVIVIVVNEVLSVDAINNSTGPFSGVHS